MKKMLSLTLAVVMILGLMVPMNAFASNEITVTVNFDESLNQNQSKEITLPNLGEIKSVTSNTGSVSHSVNGDNVTLITSGGAPSRSEQISVDTEGWLTEANTQSSQTFADTVTKVNAKGETVTLAKDGVAFVVSGSYAPADSKTVSQNQTSSTNSFASTIPYNSGGYSGMLSKNGSSTYGVLSGSYVSADSKNVSSYTSSGSEGGYIPSYEVTKVTSWSCDYNYENCRGRTTYSPSNPSIYASTFSYNKSGYVGTLNRQIQETCTYSDGDEYGGEDRYDVRVYYIGTVTRPASDTRVYGYTQNYSGTVTKPEVDTRTWGQNYKAWTVIGQEQSTKNYYSYSIDVTYSLNYSVELGAINSELDSMKQQIISRQADDRLNEFSARNQVVKQSLNAMPNETDVNVAKQKALQLDKVISAMKSIVNMENGSITEDVFNTSNIINQIEDPVLKQQLQSQLSKVSDVSSIVKAIQKAETTNASGDIKKAMAVVKQLDNDHPQKANLVAQIETVRNAFNDALTSKQKESIKKDALYFVAQTEQFGSVFYLNRAKTLVEQLGSIDTALQSELQARLTSVSGKVTSNSSFVESLAKRQLEMAEIHRHPALIKQAENSISLIKNEVVKADFMQRLEQLK